MKLISRHFLVVEGENDAYPNYKSAKIHFVEEDPASLTFKNLFICSPLFSLNKDGSSEMPKVCDGSVLTFIMVPTVYPHFNDLVNEFTIDSEAWFTLGLANLVVVENPENIGLSDKIIDFLKSRNNITGYEKWKIKDGKIDGGIDPDFQIIHNHKEVVNFRIPISNKLPLHLQFAVSEYIISVNKFLTASKKFTPYYYQRHLKLVEASKELIDDISFLMGDAAFEPTPALLYTLGVKNSGEALSLLKSKEVKRKREELINERHGQIIQFNSSMSYIYSQAYAGTFPIFDHIGIIRRHSLLGVGTAISSLYELLIQLEAALFSLPFENIEQTAYATSACDHPEYYKLFKEPSRLSNKLWSDDKIRSKVIDVDIKGDDENLPSDFLNRLSFFSGRLGFREYDFSATAAIQVLVEAHSLEWNIINYTHEIIHNHVRLILNKLIVPPTSVRKEVYEKWMGRYIDSLEYIMNNVITMKPVEGQNYIDYFNLVLIRYSTYSRYFGSLSFPSDSNYIEDLRANSSELILPTAVELQELLPYLYKDITEIFVHVIDFSYIYKRSLETYVISVWASWSTVPAVANDLTQYVVRTLTIIGLTIDGSPNFRFQKSVLKFKELLKEVSDKNFEAVVLDRISDLLEENSPYKQDLMYRFYNCIIVGDLVYNFFVGRLERYLDNDDENRLTKETRGEDGGIVSYYIETNSFEGKPIKSKVRFLLDQLTREIYRTNKKSEPEKVERTSAWLLLSLSSFHKND